MRSALLSACLIIFAASVRCDAVEFETDVAPVLIKRCLECHQQKQPSGGLSLQTADGLHSGGESGAAVTVGKPADSFLLQRVLDGEMTHARATFGGLDSERQILLGGRVQQKGAGLVALCQ